MLSLDSDVELTLRILGKWIGDFLSHVKTPQPFNTVLA